ncbi:hypothetical protein NDU88_000820 [Pleurodeles waltl]|uniref:Uncharacterized protein n=1 Tax=Pleurodeles waltl TaxID=8319 RepID=A0AAV7Q813_PLEWA|nr:hypothetical protein NDU88_000820 [Pleurodeles waltl]
MGGWTAPRTTAHPKPSETSSASDASADATHEELISRVSPQGWGFLMGFSVLSVGRERILKSLRSERGGVVRGRGGTILPLPSASALVIVTE